MKLRNFIAFAVAAAVTTGLVYAQQKAAPAKPEAKKEAPKFDPNKVLAKIGDKAITAGEIKRAADNFLAANKARMGGVEPTPQQIESMREGILGQKIQQELMRLYVKDQKIVPTKEEIATAKAEVTKSADQLGMKLEDFMKAADMDKDAFYQLAALKKLMAQAASEKKIDEIIKNHPEYFNGSTVDAEHLLIMSSPVASTKDQKKVLAEITKIKKDIDSGKITWADAVKKYSKCPSSKNGGKLGSFEFFSMVIPFSKAAFAAKVGDIVGPVRTEFGYHLIKVTGKKDGTVKFDAKNPKLRAAAKAVIENAIMSKIFAQVMDKYPLVLNK